ncbi:SPL family radical SAM protein [Granulicella arctica]|uniref:SPL family radical SAM protein n=1 Tax=Granulicella arctica TaxID=940613 RepID=UPI0021E0859E|nr:radical SAM protein [Granulicella arctica]
MATASSSCELDTAQAEIGPIETDGRLWRPRRVLITPDALSLPYGRAMLDRAASHGAEVIRLPNNRLTGFKAESESKSYALAKTTFAIVVSPPGQRKLQPIPPSADWQFHIAQGCPAHCQYCYLAGSLSGPPVTRAYANLPEILEGLRSYAGAGQVTSRSEFRAHEGTTFEASCYTDPLGIEHLTGALAESIRFFGQWDDAVQLRWTTKFAAVSPLLALEHRGHTRVRFSINAASVTRDFEGGTASIAQRLGALRRMALAGYPIGLTIAPIMPVENWQSQYTELLTAVAKAVEGVAALDLTVELITHRFTPGSKEVLIGWYPKTSLDLREEARTQKRTKFGGFKFVYPKDSMGEMRSFFEQTIATLLPTARILYWA